MRKAITIICTITIIVCAVLIVWNVVKERNHLKWEEELADEFLLPAGVPAEQNGQEEWIGEEGTEEPGEPYEYQTLSEERKNVNFPKLTQTNDNSVGWIYIPNTTINHPVVQGADNQTYLKKNIYGQYSVHGSIFVDCGNILSPMDTNVVLHGHNMGTGRTSMFSQLVKYADASFFNGHNIVQFDTKYGTGHWEVFAAFDINIAENNGGFNYTRVNFMNEQDFNDFIANVRSRSYVATEVPIKYGDKILTLSTCNKKYYGENGRFAVMAVLREGTLKPQKTMNITEDEGEI